MAAQLQLWSADREHSGSLQPGLLEAGGEQVEVPASPLQKHTISNEAWGGGGVVTAEGTPLQRFSQWWQSLAAVAR